MKKNLSKKNYKTEELRKKLFIIIFEADTKSGKLFDIILLISIFLSVLAILLNSVDIINVKYKIILTSIEWFFTILFTIEYFFRLFCVKKVFKYIKSFFGIIDLISILPSYLSYFIIGAQSLIILRVIRLLRIFIIFKLGRYIGQANFLIKALKRGFRKIIVFIGTVMTIVVVMGSLMYLIEGPENNGFSSIPKAMYWAIVTLTTVGYGDVAPQTWPGQTIAAIIMLLGYGIIAVPTGILSAEIAISSKSDKRKCPECKKTGHLKEAAFCRYCGTKLRKRKKNQK